jgi:hypothetical protein
MTFELLAPCGIVRPPHRYRLTLLGNRGRNDKEVVVMPKWPIRIKLIVGLSLVIGMMLTLMGGSIFGLHA